MRSFSIALPRLSSAAFVASVASLALAALLPLGCSPAPGDGGATCSTYAVPAGTDLTTPAVTFKADIVGNVFLNHCSFSGCHGDSQILFLGFPKASTQVTNAAEVYANIVGVPANELVTMPYVKAGDPASSYVMHKVDGDVCTLAKQCKNQDCGSSMPQNNELLDVATRDLLRRWIAQGAKND
jgi:hypothetical protein